MAASTKKNLLVIVDPQIDFYPGGSLAIAGADKDAERTAAMIRKNMDKIDHIAVTMDSHNRFHIANPLYWVDSDGNQVKPFTLITAADVKSGKYKTSRPEFQATGKEYVQKLESTGKFMHFIWPFHCIIGTPGHNVQPDIREAITEWADHKKSPIGWVPKGTNPHTEMFSAISSEVPNDDPQTQRNTKLVAEWATYDKIFFCGEAKSHCVNFTAMDFLEGADDALKQKTLLISDCTSNVPSFEQQGDDFEKAFAGLGCKVINSTDFAERCA